jgi:hypothetical protein
MRTIQDIDASVFPVAKQLEEALRTGEIDIDLYCKGHVALAFEYAVCAYGLEAASHMQRLPVSYFLTSFKTQMAWDEHFKDKVEVIYTACFEDGLFPFQVTQKPALA